MKNHFVIFVISFLSISTALFAQDSNSVKSASLVENDFAQDSIPVESVSPMEGDIAQDSIAVKPVNPSEGNSKGYYAFSVGMNFGQYTNKNEDAFIYFILDEKNIKYNVKLGFSYNIKDNRAVGVSFRLVNDDNNILYENAVGDTINTNTLERYYSVGAFYAVTKSLFKSKRVNMISDPGIIFTTGSTDATRTFEGISEQSESNLRSISLGLHVGLQVFLAPKLSAQVAVGPVGVGYQWEEFELDGEPNGDAESFFVRMSPDILSFEFSISRYF